MLAPEIVNYNYNYRSFHFMDLVNYQATIYFFTFSFPLCCAIHSLALIPSSSSSPAVGIPFPFSVFKRQSSFGRTKYTILYLGHFPCSPGAGDTRWRPEHRTPFVNLTAASLHLKSVPGSRKHCGEQENNLPKINDSTIRLGLHPQPSPLRIPFLIIIRKIPDFSIRSRVHLQPSQPVHENSHCSKVCMGRCLDFWHCSFFSGRTSGHTNVISSPFFKFVAAEEFLGIDSEFRSEDLQDLDAD